MSSDNDKPYWKRPALVAGVLGLVLLFVVLPWVASQTLMAG